MSYFGAWLLGVKSISKGIILLSCRPINSKDLKIADSFSK